VKKLILPTLLACVISACLIAGQSSNTAAQSNVRTLVPAARAAAPQPGTSAPGTTRPPVVEHESILSAAQLRQLVAPTKARYRGALVVGLISPQGKMVVGFGTDLKGKRVDGNTVFETASLSKVFSALLLAQEAAKGNIDLEQPVEELVDWQLPRFGETPITVAQLAEHTSGLPDWPSNRGSTTSNYSTADLQSYLARGQLAFKPGEDVWYSNAGYALLGEVLAKRAKTSFENLVLTRICAPLDMSSTRVRLTDDMRSRLAIGHNAGGAVMRSSAPTAGGGADGIRSTANDLLKFAGTYAGALADRARMSPAMNLSCETRAQVDQDNSIGLGWYTRNADGIVWKGGCIAGYRTYIGFLPDKHVAVVVLAGCNAFPSPEIGRKILLEATK
jgi:D-alanyl-D-alanine-carboxypeptidase/D-alanyl-D-alanine-endopeptidase